MKKKILGALLSVAMVATMLVGCGSNNASAPAADAPAAEANGKKVGVAMPTQSSERWIKDGAAASEELSGQATHMRDMLSIYNLGDAAKQVQTAVTENNQNKYESKNNPNEQIISLGEGFGKY